MLKMRLQRVGRKHEPSFRLVLTDSKNSTKSGRFKEILGSYDPRKSTDLFKTDRIKHWLSLGITPTDSVYNLLVTHKIIDGKKKNVLPRKTPQIKEQPIIDNKEEVVKAEVVQTEAEVIVESKPEEETPEMAPSEVVEVETVSEPSAEAPADESVQIEEKES